MQALGRRQQAEADLVLVCVEAGQALTDEESALLARDHPPGLHISTKCDLQEAKEGIATSATARTGLGELKAALARRGREREEPALAPSLSRCRHHVTACLEHLRRAHALALEQDPPEILALELREALRQLGEMVGAVYAEDLLDRIFSRFCIGK
jgi:tRNA modification GTPase